MTLPFGILWSTVEAEDFTLVGFDGQILRPSARINQLTGQPHAPDMTTVALHSPMHKNIGNKRAKAVFHTHQHYATTLACSPTQYRLEMIHQNSARFYNSIIYDREFDGLADSMEAGTRIANVFLKPSNNKKRVLTQRHHGVFVAGASAALALYDVYWFEKACKI